MILVIDMSTAQFYGRPWKSLGDFGKRKYENLLVLKELEKKPEEKVIVKYVQTNTQ